MDQLFLFLLGCSSYSLFLFFCKVFFSRFRWASPASINSLLQEYIHFYNKERRYPKMGDIVPKERYSTESKPTKINYICFCPNNGK